MRLVVCRFWPKLYIQNRGVGGEGGHPQYHNPKTNWETQKSQHFPNMFSLETPRAIYISRSHSSSNRLHASDSANTTSIPYGRDHG